MVYAIIGRKTGIEMICVCESRERANSEAISMLNQGYLVNVIETPLIKEI